MYNQIDKNRSLRKTDMKIVVILSITALILFLAYNYNKSIDEPFNSSRIKNGGNFIRHGNWTYYAYSSIKDDDSIVGGMYKFDEKSSKSIKIGDDVAAFINVKGNWIYYINFTKGDFNRSEIMKIKTDGTERAKLSDEGGVFLTLYKNHLYYQESGLDSTLIRIKTDGSDKQILSKDIFSFYINGDWIYYLSDSELGALYKMKLNGSSNQKICDIPGPIVYINDNFIYFKEAEAIARSNNDSTIPKASFMYTDGPLYRMRIDGSERQQIISEKTIAVYEADKHLYYVPSSSVEGRELYRADLNGENVIKLPLKGSFAGIFGNYIYYVEFKDNKMEMYRTSLDFKKTQKIENEIFNRT